MGNYCSLSFALARHLIFYAHMCRAVNKPTDMHSSDCLVSTCSLNPFLEHWRYIYICTRYNIYSTTHHHLYQCVTDIHTGWRLERGASASMGTREYIMASYCWLAACIVFAICLCNGWTDGLSRLYGRPTIEWVRTGDCLFSSFSVCSAAAEESTGGGELATLEYFSIR